MDYSALHPFVWGTIHLREQRGVVWESFGGVWKLVCGVFGGWFGAGREGLQRRVWGLVGGCNKGFRAIWRLQLGVWVLVGGLKLGVMAFLAFWIHAS